MSAAFMICNKWIALLITLINALCTLEFDLPVPHCIGCLIRWNRDWIISKSCFHTVFTFVITVIRNIGSWSFYANLVTILSYYRYIIAGFNSTGLNLFISSPYAIFIEYLHAKCLSRLFKHFMKLSTIIIVWCPLLCPPLSRQNFGVTSVYNAEKSTL